MNEYNAQQYILNSLRKVSYEQFEYLCKDVTEQIENPDQIEVTPLRSDGGIDIQGRTGGTIYTGEFGIQVKQSENKVGVEVVREFVGSLDFGGYNYGAIITTSDFTKDAREDAEERTSVSVQLISGNQLSQIMFEQQIGIIQQSEEPDYVSNRDFWTQFQEDDDLIPSSQVPQADSLDTVKDVVVGVSKGNHFKAQIARWLTEQTEDSWTRRQADYYAIAAYALGLLDKRTGQYEEGGVSREMRKWSLSEAGRKYVGLLDTTPSKSNSYIYARIHELEIVQLIVERIESNSSIAHSEITDIIGEKTAVSGSTAKRRAKTLGAWFGEMDGDIKRMGEGSQIVYALQSDISDFS